MKLWVRGAAIVALMASTAFGGDNCKNVEIKMRNTTRDEIKITTFEYYDYDKQKWRTENMFGVDGHQLLEPGKTWGKTRDLEHVKDDNTNVRVTYQHHIGGTKWNSPVSVDTGKFKCTGAPVEVVLNK